MVHKVEKKILMEDGTIKIETEIIPWCGDSEEARKEKLGDWTIETVKNHKKYKGWLENLKRGIGVAGHEDLINTPYPNIEECKEANRLADARLEEARLKGPIPRPGAWKENRMKGVPKKKTRNFESSSDDDLTDDQDDQDSEDDENDEDEDVFVVAKTKPGNQSKARKDNIHNKRPLVIVEGNTPAPPARQNSHQAGARLRRAADKEEEKIVELAKGHAETLDSESFNGGEKIYRGESLIAKIADALGVKVQFPGDEDESSNVDENSEEDEEGEEESAFEVRARRAKRVRYA
jgi:hypothetical protein